MLFTLTPLAEEDLEVIADYIAQDNPKRALSFINELRNQCAVIAQNTHAYRRRIELGNDIRSYTHGNYVIFFTDTPHELTIIRILHGARDLTSVFSNDPDDRG